MKILINNIDDKDVEIISFKDLGKFHENFKKYSSIKEPLEVRIFAINESISSQQLSKLKNSFEKNNIHSVNIYSNNRETILSGKSLKIDSTFVQEQEAKNKLNLLD